MHHQRHHRGENSAHHALNALFSAVGAHSHDSAGSWPGGDVRNVMMAEDQAGGHFSNIAACLLLLNHLHFGLTPRNFGVQFLEIALSRFLNFLFHSLFGDGCVGLVEVVIKSSLKPFLFVLLLALLDLHFEVQRLLLGDIFHAKHIRIRLDESGFLPMQEVDLKTAGISLHSLADVGQQFLVVAAVGGGEGEGVGFDALDHGIQFYYLVEYYRTISMGCQAINLMKKEQHSNCEIVSKIKTKCNNSESSYEKAVEGSTQVGTAMNSFWFQVNRKDRSCSGMLKGPIRSRKGERF